MESEKKSVVFLAIILAMLTITSASLASALGVSPADKKLNFQPNTRVEVWFNIINSEGGTFNATIWAYDELAPITTVPPEQVPVIASEYRIPFPVTIDMPATMTPGTHKVMIKIIPEAPEGSGIGAYGCPLLPIYVIVPEPPVVDSDNDGIIDSNDNCVNIPNADQADCNANGVGDACDAVNPNAAETCDGIDNNCNNEVDEDGDSLCSALSCSCPSGGCFDSDNDTHLDDYSAFPDNYGICSGTAGCGCAVPECLAAITFNDYSTCGCTPDFRLTGEWSTCDITDRQFQNYYDAEDCPGAVLPTAESQACDYCTPNWAATNSSCISGIITETYSDTNGCYAKTGLASDIDGKPSDKAYACTLPPVCGDGICNGNEVCSTCASDCGVCHKKSSGGGGGSKIIASNWTCGNWSVCKKGTQTQNCTQGKATKINTRTCTSIRTLTKSAAPETPLVTTVTAAIEPTAQATADEADNPDNSTQGQAEPQQRAAVLQKNVVRENDGNDGIVKVTIPAWLMPFIILIAVVLAMVAIMKIITALF
jgi:hypothetical protein